MNKSLTVPPQVKPEPASLQEMREIVAKINQVIWKDQELLDMAKQIISLGESRGYLKNVKF